MNGKIDEEFERFSEVWIPKTLSADYKNALKRAFFVGASKAYELLMLSTSGKKQKAAVKNMNTLRAEIKQGVLESCSTK